MKSYCLGFVFYDRKVLLLRKNRPKWQAGKLNGLGGHIEDNESPWSAMQREFQEETGFDQKFKWLDRGLILADDYQVNLFSLQCGEISYIQMKYDKKPWPRQVEEGELNWYDIDDLKQHNPLDNIPLLIPLLNGNEEYKYYLDYRGETKDPLVWSEEGEQIK